MLKDIKKRIEEVTKEHFEEVLGEEFEVELNWGIPNTTLVLKKEKEDFIMNCAVTFETESDSKANEFNLQTIAFRIEEEKRIPEQVSLDSSTINFLINRTRDIHNSFFSPNVEEKSAEPTEEKESIESDADITES